MPDSTVVTNDLSSFWMPFTANRQFKKNPRPSYNLYILYTVKCRFSKKMDRPKPLAKMEKFAKTEQLANFKNHEILHLIFENFQMFSTNQLEVCTSYLLSL